LADAAADLAVITPSYAPDLELCSDLNESVLRNTPESVKHYIVTPGSAVKQFARLRGTRTEVLSIDEVLPQHVLRIPGMNFWLNVRYPFPPVRGWVMQQIVKLQMAAQVNAELLLLADSDVRMVRPVTSNAFRIDGRPRFYRKDNEVDTRLPRHLIWYNIACKLLGVPSDSPPVPDYVNAFNVWDRNIVLAMQDRIQQTTGKPWIDAVAGQMHVGEFMIYGVFVDKVLGARANVAPADTMLCHSYWKAIPLDSAKAAEFVRKMPDGDVAIMISAKSGTPLEVRRNALAKLS